MLTPLLAQAAAADASLLRYVELGGASVIVVVVLKLMLGHIKDILDQHKMFIEGLQADFKSALDALSAQSVQSQDKFQAQIDKIQSRHERMAGAQNLIIKEMTGAFDALRSTVQVMQSRFADILSRLDEPKGTTSDDRQQPPKPKPPI